MATKKRVNTALPVDAAGEVQKDKLRADAAMNDPGHKDGAWLAANATRRRRPGGPKPFTAILRRGLSYVLSYDDGSLTFERGKPVAVDASEVEHLRGAYDAYTLHDPIKGCYERRVSKFEFFDAANKPLAARTWPDRPVGEDASADAFAAAQAERDAASLRA